MHNGRMFQQAGTMSLMKSTRTMHAGTYICKVSPAATTAQFIGRAFTYRALNSPVLYLLAEFLAAPCIPGDSTVERPINYLARVHFYALCAKKPCNYTRYKSDDKLHLFEIRRRLTAIIFHEKLLVNWTLQNSSQRSSSDCGWIANYRNIRFFDPLWSLENCLFSKNSSIGYCQEKAIEKILDIFSSEKE